VTGLGDQLVEIAMLRTPDGHSRVDEAGEEAGDA
jgi:hypothetical protein